MNKKKILFDSAFIITAAILLIVLAESGLIKEYIGFALIPILMAYYLVLLPVSSFRPILDLFAHICVAPQSRSFGYAPSSRLDLSKNLLRLF